MTIQEEIDLESVILASGFSKNDIVIYTSKRYTDAESDPHWGGRYGYITGKITEFRWNTKNDGKGGMSMNVEWENGTHNSYEPKDIIQIKPNTNSKIVL